MQFLFDEKNKKENILEKYISIIKKNNYKSNDVLMLVDNNIIKLDYIQRINLEMSEELKICTYSQFVKQELIKYWSIVSNKCKLISNECISPNFISNNLKSYIFETKVKKSRHEKNYFEDITGTDKSIASNIILNLDHALYNDLDYKTIGEKIYNSKSNIENIDKLSYLKMNEIIKEYIDDMITNSVLDDSISVYLYNKYLLKDDLYIKKLLDRYNYILVDDLQNICVSEVYLLELFKQYNKEIYLYLDNSRYFSSFIKNDLDYTYEHLLNSKYNYSNIKVRDLKRDDYTIELNQNNQLYSEMISDIIEKIKELINNKEEKRDICIITPINSSILDYEISKELDKYNIDVLNTKKDTKMIDYPYGNLLYVAICLFCGLDYYIKEEEYINFIQIIFDINRIKAYKIYKDKSKNEDYQNLMDYIFSKRAKGITISEFLLKFYIDKVLNLKNGRDNVSLCQNIISESEVFEECLKKLNLKDSKATKEVFVESLRKIVKDYYSSSEIKEITNENKILITTPYSYISNKLSKKIQLWVDIGSNSWNMKIEKELSNLSVLKKTYQENKKYTSDIEEYQKRYYLNNTIYNLLKDVEHVYAFKSDYSINGYMQEGSLYNIILKLIDEGDENCE